MAKLGPKLSLFNWVLLLVAAYALVTIIVLFMIDTVINGLLYSHALQFSNDWATLYQTTIRTGFVLSLLVIILALGLLVHFARKTEETVEGRTDTGLLNAEPCCTYTLSDGSTIKVKHKLKSAKRLEKYSPDGMPVYVVDCDNIVQVVNIPEKLTRRTKK